MSEHLHIPELPLHHPLAVCGFVIINIFLSTVPVEKLGMIAHAVVYSAQIIAACMAAVASFYAIRHYRFIYDQNAQK